MPIASSDQAARHERLKTFLRSDPDNCALLSEAADAALAAHAYADAQAYLERRSTLTAPGDREQSMAGLAAMGLGDFKVATHHFQALRARSPDDPTLRFNLAWSLAMTKNFDLALDLLDPTTTAALPQAAMLEVQLLHHAERLGDALTASLRHLARHPDDPGLNAAVSVLAIDAEDRDLAAATAVKAPTHPDSQTTLGMLALGAEEPERALTLFEAALENTPGAPRALVGRGLGRLICGQIESGAVDIEAGAFGFGDHIGSWIAAGWARLVLGDRQAARAHFERAFAIDPAFAETHGSLGVIALLEGDLEAARLSAQKALRLDRRSFSAALLQALIVQSKGDAQAAHALVERALSIPLDASGKTLAHSLAKFGLFP